MIRVYLTPLTTYGCNSGIVCFSLPLLVIPVIYRYSGQDVCHAIHKFFSRICSTITNYFLKISTKDIET